MRLWLGLLLVACASPSPRHPSVPVPDPTCAPVGSPQPTTTAVVDPLAPEPKAAEVSRRSAEIQGELDDLTREIDALDLEIAAFAAVGDPRRDEAITQMLERQVKLEPVAIDQVFDAPSQLQRIASSYRALYVKRLELERELGPKNQTMVALNHTLDWLKAAFDRQKQAELREIATLRKAYLELRPTASLDDVRKARLRAQFEVLVSSSSDGVVPSDAPASLRVPIDRAFDATRRIEEQAGELGPKHPEMQRLIAERDMALADIDAAIKTSGHELVDALAASKKKPPPFDASKLRRRVELASRARELRAELAALALEP